MKKIFTLLFTLITFLGFSQSSTLVISQVYGAGGNAGATYKADYVELHNISTTAISLDGLSVQYGSSTTTNTWTGFAALPSVSVPAGGYYLVQMSVAGVNGIDIPTPDFVANPAIAMAAANGKVALVMGLDTISNCSATSIIDVVGYGTANCGEGTTTGALSATTAALRNNNGCTDTNDNSADFTVGAPSPKNSGTAVQSCSATTTPTVTASSLTDFGTVVAGDHSTSQTLTISGSDLTGAPGDITVTAPAGFEVSLDGITWSSSVTVPYSSETLSSTNIFVRFSPTADGPFAGEITISGGGLASSVTVPVSGTGGTVAPENPAVTTNTLTDFGTVTVGSNSTSQTLTISGTDLTGAPGNITVTAPAGFEVSTDGTTWSSSVTVPYTSATLSSTNIFVRFSPTAEGSASGNIIISGGGLTPDVTVAVSGNGSTTTPTTTGLVISQAFGSGGNAGAPFNADFVELHNNSNASISLSGLSIQYGSATSSTWSGVSALPAASIPAGGYYLIQISAIGANGASLPTPDYIATPPISMAGANGKVAIVTGTTAVASCTESTIIDLLGYGTANCGETAPSAAMTSTTAAWRLNNGCTDTDDNSADFTIEAPAPRNSASALFSCSTTTTPAITASTLTDFGSVTIGSNSASQTLTISGTDLTGAPGNITVTAPTGFEISLDGTTWSSTVDVPYASGTLASTSIFVRFSPTAAGPAAGNISISGGGITTAVTVAVSGTGTTASVPSLTTTTLTGFGENCLATTTSANSFTITGTNLTTADITVGPLAGFTFSTTEAGTYTPSLTLTQAGGSYSQIVYVKFNPTAVQSYDGNIAVNGGGVTTSVNVAATGSGANSAATVSTDGVSALTSTSVTLAGSVTNNGCSAITTYGIAYSTTSGFTTGTEVNSTNMTSNVFTSDVSGLAPSTTYYYKAFAVNAAGISYGIEKTFTTTGASQFSALVISQVFGGGGNTGAPFNADYVELHNGSSAPVSLDGMSVQYASATNTATWNATTALPAVTIPVGGYFLVQMSATGAVGAALPTPDHIANPPIAMSGTNGKVALVNGTTALASCVETNILDLVGFGSANCAETTPTPALSNTTAGFRNQNGCIDTDNNLADFTIAAPAPRNSATPILSCGGPVPTLTTSTLVDFGTVILGENSASQTLNLSGTLLTGFPGNITVTAPAGFEVSLDGTTWTSSVSVPYTSATLASTPVFVRFTPTVVGTAAGNITISGGGANTTIAISGNGGTTPADVTITSLEEFGVVCINEVGGPNSFTITGTGLNTTPVVVGPLNGFTFATTAAGTYSTTLSIPQGGGTFNQTVFVKFAPLAGTSYSGDIPVTGGGISGTLNVAASGSGNSAGASLITGDVSLITSNSALAAGQITENACSPATEYGIAVSGIQNFSVGIGRNIPSTNIDAAGNFTAQLTGLVQNTIYYYKSYVVNAGVTTYGEEKTFTTKPIGNGLIVYSNPIIRGNTMHFSISGVQPGHYSARFYNMLGQVVFQRDIILQVNYIDDYFVVPTTIPKGVYRFQVINQVYKSEKTIIVL